MDRPISSYSYAQAGVRLALRKCRRGIYSLFGRNPYVGGSHAPSTGEEWRAVRALLEARRSVPVLLGEVPAGGLWNTCAGKYVFLKGLDPFYVRIAAEEQAINVYGLTARDKIVVDCGANVGLFTKYALQSGAERVIAFEPSPGNAACFRYNLADEFRAGRITLIEKGLLDREGEVRFFTPKADPFAHAVAEDGTGDSSIPVTTLDRALEEIGVKHVDFIKMDIEGSELRAIEGARNILQGIRPRISIGTEHTADYFANTAQVIDRMVSLGYDYLCTQSLPHYSPSLRKTMLTPHCVLFNPRGA